MSDGPSGTVTFLFTDVEGSTKLLERFPDSYPAAIEQHHSILRETVDVHDGQVFETIGDAVYAAFPRAADCVAAALAAQRRLQSEPCGETARSASGWASTPATSNAKGPTTSDALCTDVLASCRSDTAARS